MINVHEVLVKKCDGEGTLRRHRRRWENNYRIDLRDIRWENMEWM
jgi:hypothetical protein